MPNEIGEVFAKAEREAEVRNLLRDYQKKNHLSSEEMINLVASGLASQILDAIMEGQGEGVRKRMLRLSAELHQEIQSWTDETIINFNKVPLEEED